jgi:transcriptional regulator with XRE-family HTH domain
MDTNTVGSFIAQLRKEKGYTQKELAEKLKVTDKAVSRWETGKGLPDTSLLKPLSDILGVSVGELLSGKMIEDAERKEQIDQIILDTLRYSKRMLARTVTIILFIIGIAFLLSPVFLAASSSIWIWGIFITATAVLFTFLQKKEDSIKWSNKSCYLSAVVLQGAAFVLELLPVGAVMVFASGPNERITEVYSYFSLLPLGYANFTPMLTGALTVAVLLLGIIVLIRFDKAKACRKAAFLCSIIALLFSIVPLFLYGTIGMTAASYTICGTIALSICLQAVANRQE